ncbi:MAG: NUDIX hydrolase [Candidatus Pacebacteria bacterium]|jgi:8-oxo-dGTP diphosphatase|nr:NUDIX hydrolase [Candidatus Paceibacterota bacterium]
MITCQFENKNKNSLRHVVVDNLVIDGNKILLVKRGPKYSEPNKWALPGGFVDRDETTREAAVREILEETGYQSEVVELFRIIDNPNRPKEDRQNISLIYILKPLKKVGESDHEIANTKWFDLNKLPKESDFAFDHYSNIRIYKIHLQNRFQLPITDMNLEDIEGWEETLDIMSNPQLVKDINKGIEEIKQGKVVTHEELLKDLEK